ncbi:NAD(P)/FAD-dependent oxidoreductase [Glycomyces halotolerans]
MSVDEFDVVVVGGGAAGLSGALTLARARRSVLVVDAGRPRNAPAEGIHAYLTRDRMSPRSFVEAGREEVRGYGGVIREGAVAAIETAEEGFTVGLDGGAAVRGRRLLVATGLVDELPAVPGLAERWGREVLHCPYCHGWEVRDQAVAVLATGPLSVHQALMWRQWTDQVTLLRHTAGAFAPDEEERLAAMGVAVVDGEVAAVNVEGGRLAGVVLADGGTVACRALVVAPKFTASAGLLAGLGLEATPLMREGHQIGSYVETDPTGATAVSGVWAAGNVANPMAQVVAAAESGVRAGAAINADLTEAAVRSAVEARRAALAR